MGFDMILSLNSTDGEMNSPEQRALEKAPTSKAVKIEQARQRLAD